MFLNKLSFLFKTDWARVKDFFRDQKVAKLLVALVGLLLITTIVAFVYFASFNYFSAFRGYKPYGLLTSRYLVHAGLVVTSWIVFVSAIASTTATLVKPSSELKYLIRQPKSNWTISLWLLLRPIINTASILAFLWVPSTIAFQQVYGELSSGLFTISILLLTFLIATVIQVLASVISLILSPIIQGKETISAGVAIVGLVGGTLGLIRLVLPRSLAALLRVDIGQFIESYYQLPLSSEWLPTGQLITFFETGQVVQVLPVVFFGLAIIVASVFIFKTFLDKTLKLILAKNLKTRLLRPPLSWWFIAPLTIKEMLSVFRTKSERNSLLFFWGLAIFLFFFLQRAFLLNPELSDNPTILLQYALGGILFIVTAALLRIIFPLLSREAQSAWYMLREPSSISKWQNAKAVRGIGICVVFSAITLIGWSMIPISMNEKVALVVLSLVGIGLLAVVNSWMGLLVADWRRGQTPELVSTSLIGIISLIISLVAIGGLVTSYGLVKEALLELTIPVFSYLSATFGLFVILKLMTQWAGKKYWFGG